MKEMFNPSRLAARLLSRGLPAALKAAFVLLASPVVSAVGWVWLFWLLSRAFKTAIVLRRLAKDRLSCSNGHHVALFGKWRCPVCHGIWEGSGHRCSCCGVPMNYLECQRPGCGVAAGLPCLPE